MIRATFNSGVFLLALWALLGNAVRADESLRIARPQRAEPAAVPEAKSATDACCGSSACGSPICGDKDAPVYVVPLSSSLPAEGLYARWRNEFVNPTTCPIRLCHGSCAGSQMGCKSVKTMIDSLLDAYIPEEPSVQAVLNFRCCAGFTDE